MSEYEYDLELLSDEDEVDLEEFEVVDEQEVIDEDVVIINDHITYAHVFSLIFPKYKNKNDKFLSRKTKNYVNLFFNRPSPPSKLYDAICPIVQMIKYHHPSDNNTLYRIDPNNNIAITLNDRVTRPFLSDASCYFHIDKDQPALLTWSDENNEDVFEQLRLVTSDQVNITGFTNRDLSLQQDETLKIFDVTKSRSAFNIYNEPLMFTNVDKSNIHDVITLLTYNPAEHIKSNAIANTVLSLTELNDICQTNPLEYKEGFLAARNFLETNITAYAKSKTKKQAKPLTRTYNSPKLDLFVRNITVAKGKYIDGKPFRFNHIKNTEGDFTRFLNLLKSTNYNEKLDHAVDMRYSHQIHGVDASSSIVRSYVQCLENNKSNTLLLLDPYISSQKLHRTEVTPYGLDPILDKEIEVQVEETVISGKASKKTPLALNKLYNELQMQQRIRDGYSKREVQFHNARNYSIYQGKGSEIAKEKEEVGEQGIHYDVMEEEDDNELIVPSNEYEEYVYKHMKAFDVKFPTAYFEVCSKIIGQLLSQSDLTLAKIKKTLYGNKERELKVLCIFVMVALVSHYRFMTTKSGKLEIIISNCFKQAKLSNIFEDLVDVGEDENKLVTIIQDGYDRYVKTNKLMQEYNRDNFTKDDERTYYKKQFDKYSLGPMFTSIQKNKMKVKKPLNRILTQIKALVKTTQDIDKGSIHFEKGSVTTRLGVDSHGSDSKALANISSSITHFISLNELFTNDEVLIEIVKNNNFKPILSKCKELASDAMYDILLKSPSEHKFGILSKFMLYDFEQLVGKLVLQFKFNESYIDKKKWMKKHERSRLIELNERSLIRLDFGKVSEKMKPRLQFIGIKYLTTPLTTVTKKATIHDRIIVLSYVMLKMLDLILQPVSYVEQKKLVIEHIQKSLENTFNYNDDNFESILDDFERQREDKKQKYMERLKAMNPEDRYLNRELIDRGIVNKQELLEELNDIENGKDNGNNGEDDDDNNDEDNDEEFDILDEDDDGTDND